jgi:hypothetical protein
MIGQKKRTRDWRARASYGHNIESAYEFNQDSMGIALDHIEQTIMFLQNVNRSYNL